jgi:ribose 5-phosphate isomerase B
MDLSEIQKKLREARRSPARPGKHRLEDEPALKLALGADHGGFALRENLARYLRELGYAVDDLGTTSREPVDYPDFAVAVARRVASGACALGVVVDGAGLGSCMAANKVRGVRAATCHDETTVRNSREHNNANVLALGSGVVNAGHARRLVRIWLETPFAGGRHTRRVDKIDALDRER